MNVTAVVPVKFVPVMVTSVPTGPFSGAKRVIVGGGTVTLNRVALVPVPWGVVTRTGPVVAPGGTVAAIEVDE